MFTHPRWLTSGAVIVALAPATIGCSPEPVETTTPDPATIAESSLAAYVDTWVAVGADSGTDSDRFADVATGEALEDLESAASTWRDLQISWEGERSDVVKSAEFDDETITMTYCADTTDFGPRGVDGSEVGYEHGKHLFTATLSQVDGDWLFSSQTPSGDC